MKKLVITSVVLLFAAGAVNAVAPISFFDLLTFDKNGEFDAEDAHGYNLAVTDLGGDGKHEVVLGAIYGELPKVSLYSGDGVLINEFLAYGEGFRGGVSVASGDLDGDGKYEIITGAGEGGGPHVRILDGYGKSVLAGDFFAFGKDDYHYGIKVGVFDMDGDDRDEILVSSGFGYSPPTVKIFKPNGELIKAFEVDDFDSMQGLNISRIDLGGDGKDEILVSGTYGSRPMVAIYRADGSRINQFNVYIEKFRGGVVAIGEDLDGDGREEIVTSAGFTGGPHIKILDGYGKLKHESFVGDYDFDRGLNIAIGDLDGNGSRELISVAQLEKVIEQAGHYVDINVSTQRFAWYDQGYKVGDYLTSTGKPSTQTRLGDFTAFSKYDMAYGSGDGQRWGMPNFVGFYTSGNLENGIHSLPYIDGAKEGPGSLGTAVSHGCVRLDDTPSDKFFQWIQLGDKITVHR